MRYMFFLLLLGIGLWMPVYGQAPSPPAFAEPDAKNNPQVLVAGTSNGSYPLITLSPEGRYVASLSRGGRPTVRIWDITSGRLRQEIFPERTSGPRMFNGNLLLFSPDSRTLLADGDRYDVATGKKLGELECPVPLPAFTQSVLHVSRSGRSLAVVFGFNPGRDLSAERVFVSVYDVESGRRKWTSEQMRVQAFSLPINFSADEKELLFGRSRFDAETGERIGILHPPGEDGLNALSLSSEGRFFFAFDGQGRFRRWDSQTGKEIGPSATASGSLSSTPFRYNPPTALEINGHNRILFFATDGSRAWCEVWDGETGHCIRQYTGVTTNPYAPMPLTAYSLLGQPFHAVDNADVLQIWDTGHQRLFRSFGVHGEPIVAGSFSADAKLLALTSGSSATILVTATGRRLRTLHTPRVLFRDYGGARGLNVCFNNTQAIFSPDSRQIAFRGVATWYCPDGNGPEGVEVIPLFDARTGKLTRTLMRPPETIPQTSRPDVKMVVGRQASIQSLIYSPNGKCLVTLSDLKIQRGVVTLWDIATGRCRTLFVRSNESEADLSDHNLNADRGQMAFSADGSKLVLRNRYAPERDLVLDISKGVESPPAQTTVSRAEGDSIAPNLTPRYAFHYIDDKSFSLLDQHNPVRQIGPIKTDDAVSRVDYSPDGRYFVTGDFYSVNAVRLYRTEDGSEILKYRFVGDSDYIAVTPDNFYMATKNALRAVVFRKNGEIFSFDQFDLRLNRPDVILQRLGYLPAPVIKAYHNAYLKRLKQNGFTAEMLAGDLHVPEVTLDYQKIPVATSAPRLTLQVKASDSDYLLNRLKVSINDVPVNGAVGIDLRARKTRAVTVPVTLVLSPGRNKIQISALNEKGAESFFQTVEVFYSAPPAPPNLYFLGIGVSKYQNAQYDLNYAAKDAGDLARFFADHGAAPVADKKKAATPFGKVFVKLLLDQDATRAKIEAAKAFLEQAKEKDQVVVFVAGHGMLDDKLDYYFGTHDIDFRHPSERGLPYESLEGLLDGLTARRKLLLMDTCHAGEVDTDATTPASDRVLVADAAPGTAPDTSGLARGVTVHEVRGQDFATAGGTSGSIGLTESFQLMQELFTDMRRGNGALVIAAAAGAEYAFEENGNGVFTYTVLEGLRGRAADANHDGRISVSELRDFVAEKVAARTGGRQTPTARREPLDFDFTVY